MPILHADKDQCAEIVSRYFGKISPRTFERWPLTWRKVNGRNITPVPDLLAEAKRRYEAAPLIRGGSSGTTADAPATPRRKAHDAQEYTTAL